MTWVDVGANVAAERNAAASANQLGIPSLSLRSDADTSYVADGDLAMLHVDEEGRLKTSSKTASFPLVTGTVATVAAQLAADVSRASNVVFHVKNTSGTNMTAGTWVFEGSIDSTNGTDGTWFAIQAIRSNANTIETTSGTLTLNAGLGLAYSWEASVNAYQWFRVRCTVAATASTTPVWSIRRGSYATEPIPGSQVSGTQPVSGSLTSAGTTTATPANPTTWTQTTTSGTNGAAGKASAGNLYEITVSNTSGATVYFKVYNKASAPTVGTDVPILTIPVAAGVTTFVNFPPIGKRFSTGISFATTGGLAATDTTAVAAGIQNSVSYL